MALLGVNTVTVGVSSLTESVISGQMAATTAGGAAALTGVLPMATDADSAALAVALNASGGAYLATMAEHVGQRATFAGAQNLASVTYLLNELAGAVRLAL